MQPATGWQGAYAGPTSAGAHDNPGAGHATGGRAHGASLQVRSDLLVQPARHAAVVRARAAMRSAEAVGTVAAVSGGASRRLAVSRVGGGGHPLATGVHVAFAMVRYRRPRVGRCSASGPRMLG